MGAPGGAQPQVQGGAGLRRVAAPDQGQPRLQGQVDAAAHRQPRLQGASTSTTKALHTSCHTQGPWKPRDIPNPEYHEDKEPLKHIGEVGAAAIEIWTMEDGYFFDNIVVAATEDEVASIRETYWKPKHEAEVRVLKRTDVESMHCTCRRPRRPRRLQRPRPPGSCCTRASSARCGVR